MHGHASPDYACPFCRNAATGGSDLPLEIVHRDDDVFVKVNPGWWPNNPGSVLVIPIAHHENVFDLPLSLAMPIQRAVRAAAVALKTAYGCDGISTRQHNEPAGDQDVWHRTGRRPPVSCRAAPRLRLGRRRRACWVASPAARLRHVHVFPRWEGDELYASQRQPADPVEMRRRADLLRAAWPTG